MNARAIAKLMLDWFDCLYSYEQILYKIYISGEINNKVFCFVISEKHDKLQIETHTKNFDGFSNIETLTDLAHLWYRVTEQEERIIYSSVTIDGDEHPIAQVESSSRIVLDVERDGIMLNIATYSDGVHLKNTYLLFATTFDVCLSKAIEKHCCVVYTNAHIKKYYEYAHYFERRENK